LNEHLIVFTRYPEPGRTKTRLIPGLGAAGAALVQRQMTEHSLRTVRVIQQQRPLQVWVCYAGAEEAAFRDWLGEDWNYLPQAEGDLGDRMVAAFRHAFSHNAERVITIGIDCPDITPALLTEALDQLHSQDLVLGPASDGGYYLIGLQRVIPSLFKAMDWGTDRVLADSLSRAAAAGLDIAQLTTLTDIDYPEDLPRWTAHHSNAPPAQVPLISIIMPVRNEAAALVAHLPELIQQARHSEIIVVDGDSYDSSVTFAKALGVRVQQGPANRAQQMNAGAAIATGDILLFLHGDTRLPADFEAQIRQTLALEGVVAGAFELHIDGEGAGLRRVEWGVRQRSKWLGLPYGDQGLFLARSQFEALGGFADLPIMEDFELMQRVKQLGRVAIAPAAVTTSGRRWQRLGVQRTTLINQGMLLGYALGIPPAVLARWYRNPGKIED